MEETNGGEKVEICSPIRRSARIRDRVSSLTRTYDEMNGEGVNSSPSFIDQPVSPVFSVLQSTQRNSVSEKRRKTSSDDLLDSHRDRKKSLPPHSSSESG